MISYAYSRIIEYFPSGGGGYIVATQTLGRKRASSPAAALLVDYILTITVSIVSCGDAIFSFFPASWQPYKIPFEICAIILLVVLNLRGVKESVTVPGPDLPRLRRDPHPSHRLRDHHPHSARSARSPTDPDGISRPGWPPSGAAGMFLLFLRAFSMGGGTYTGIEAVSNGLQILREPRVQNGQEDDGLYGRFPGLHGRRHPPLLPALGRRARRRPDAQRRPGRRGLRRLDVGRGPGPDHDFLRRRPAAGGRPDRIRRGPRVMANMAVDYWFPHRFASLSDRFTIQNGVLLMGGAAVASSALFPRDASPPWWSCTPSTSS